MKTAWALLLLVGFSWVCRAQEPLPAWNDEARKAWWVQNPAPPTWPKAARDLRLQLEAFYKANGPTSFSQADFQGWMEQLEWIGLGVSCPDILADKDNFAAFIALGREGTVSHLFVEKLDPRDDKREALRHLLRLAQARPDDLHDFAALAVAYCLVFDQPFPRDWPHPQVRREAVPIGDLDVVQRFAYYVQASRDKKTDLDLSQLDFESLKYLVDSEAKLSEFDYAQKNRISFSHFDQAFFSINYDDTRLKPPNEIFEWQYPAYTLKDIETHGGICVDQAYYAATLGKGRGIPTLYFQGQGTDGGHAWFGYLSRNGKWELDCGRYASQNYPKGFALDPQTWRVVKDTMLENLAKNGESSAGYQPAQTALAWARLHEGEPAYKPILDEARTLMPELAQTWITEADFIDASELSLDDKKAFYESWNNQFKAYPDMKVDGQQRLLALLKQANDPQAKELQRSIIVTNRNSGIDLGIQGSSGAIGEKIESRDWDGAKLEFQKAVRDFKDQGGGTFFYQVVRPYAGACVSAGRFDQAQEGLKFVSGRMTINDGSILAQEFTQLKGMIETAREVLPLMEKWLGEMDEGNYEQAWNEGGKDFQEQVTLGRWLEGMGNVRKPLGKFVSRAMAYPPERLDHLQKNKGAVLSGDFFYMQYWSVFENQPRVYESVVFQKADGGWALLSYRCQRTPPTEQAN